MKNHKSVWALLLVGVLALTGCDLFFDRPDAEPPTPQTAGPWSGTDALGTTYTLAVTENTSRAVYVEQTGDTYVLTIMSSDGTVKTSQGTVVSISGGTLTLQPENAGAPEFTVTRDSNGTITSVSGMVTLTDGTTFDPHIPVPDIGPAETETGVFYNYYQTGNPSDPDYIEVFPDGKLFWLYSLDENGDGYFTNDQFSYVGYRGVPGILAIFDDSCNPLDDGVLRTAMFDGDKIAADFAAHNCSRAMVDPANAGTHSIADIINSMAVGNILRVDTDFHDSAWTAPDNWFVVIKRVF
jgi:hypothetical protein